MKTYSQNTGRVLALASVVIGFGMQGHSASASSILFVGNSFTYGEAAGGPDLVRPYMANTVTDLNNTRVGGVPALFKSFTTQAGLDYTVSLETVGGTGLDFHYLNRLGVIDRPWDDVVLQSYSTLDVRNPGNPATLIQYSALLADVFAARNPDVDIHLDATWSRADQTYRPGGFWFGQPIDAMYRDVQAGYEAALANSPLIDGVIRVGAAWNEAIQTGFADDNPYDGIAAGTVNLWAPDAYHASTYGYYLEALTMFGAVTGVDPRSLGGSERSAADLGITPVQAQRLQQFAFNQLAVDVPEPAGTLPLVAGLLGLALLRRRAA